LKSNKTGFLKKAQASVFYWVFGLRQVFKERQNLLGLCVLIGFKLLE